MNGAPEQLSLPLFEAESVEGPPQRLRRRRAKRKPHLPVVVSRPESPPVAAGKNVEPTASSALLTTQEAAELLRVHPRTVQRLVERGELAAVHLGSAVRFDPTDVADLTARLKQRTTGKPSACVDLVRPSGTVRVSFADRLRVQHEH